MRDLVSLLNTAVYPAQGLLALYGIYCLILVFRRIMTQRFKSGQQGEAFLEDVGEKLKVRDYDGAAEVCDSPPYWSKGVPQLALVALENKDRDLGDLQRMLAEQFEREVLAGIANRMSWINTVVKVEPMLGLLGTVMGMIEAFAKIAESQQKGNDPSKLADDISFALITTAIGLIISIPLVMGMAAINVRLGALQDQIQQYLTRFLDLFEDSRKKEKTR